MSMFEFIKKIHTGLLTVQTPSVDTIFELCPPLPFVLFMPLSSCHLQKALLKAAVVFHFALFL